MTIILTSVFGFSNIRIILCYCFILISPYFLALLVIFQRTLENKHKKTKVCVILSSYREFFFFFLARQKITLDPSEGSIFSNCLYSQEKKAFQRIPQKVRGINQEASLQLVLKSNFYILGSNMGSAWFPGVSLSIYAPTSR